MNHTRMIPKLLPTGGLRRSLERLSEHLIARIPDMNVALKTSRVMRKIARLIIQIERRNGRITLKQNMLKSPHWRARVLRDLGGDVALSRWDKSFKRSQERRNIRPAQLTGFEVKWREHRNAAQARLASFAPSHPLIFKDAIKVDFEGQFRLAPLSRISGHRISGHRISGHRISGPRRKTAAEKTRARRELGALKLWGHHADRELHRRRRPDRLNPIALLPRELRGNSGAGGGPGPFSPLIPVKTGNCAKFPVFTGMSGNGATPPTFSSAQSLIRAGPFALRPHGF